MTTALEKLLEVRTCMDHCHTELGLGAELAAHLNDAQLAKAKACYTATAIALHWTHLDSISALICKVTEEGQICQAFMGKLSATLQACPSEDHWALMYPLQFLVGGVPLGPLLGIPATAQLQDPTDAGSVPVPLTLSMSGTPAPQPCGMQWCHSSNQGMPHLGQEEEVPYDLPEEPPTRNRNLWLESSGRPNERPSLRTLRW